MVLVAVDRRTYVRVEDGMLVRLISVLNLRRGSCFSRVEAVIRKRGLKGMVGEMKVVHRRGTEREGVLVREVRIRLCIALWPLGGRSDNIDVISIVSFCFFKVSFYLDVPMCAMYLLTVGYIMYRIVLVVVNPYEPRVKMESEGT